MNRVARRSTCGDDLCVHIDIRVTGGIVRGEAEADLAVFRGIPYADTPVRLRRATAGSGLARRTGGNHVRAATSAVRGVRNGRCGRGRRRLADGQCVVTRPQRRIAGDGVDPGRRLRIRHVRPARVRRQQPRARRRRTGDLQLPGRTGRLRLRRRNARQPWLCSTSSRRSSGCRRTSARSAVTRAASPCSASPRAADRWRRCWRCHARRDCSAGRSRKACQARTSPPSLPADIARACAAELGLQPTELSTVDPRLLPAAGDAVAAKIGQFADRWGQAAHGEDPVRAGHRR